MKVAYGAIEAVKGVSPQVSAGELVSLIGANGAGKTSTLNAIAGSVKASTGEIRFNGEIVNALPAHRRLRRGVALVPEGRGIFSRLTVHENLQMGAYIRNDTDGIAQDLQRVYALLPRIRERLDQVAGTLRRRAADGRDRPRLALAPETLLLDEPSMGLAPLIVEKIFEVVPLRGEGGMAVLLVEQNANLALEASERAYVMETGTITLMERMSRLKPGLSRELPSERSRKCAARAPFRAEGGHCQLNNVRNLPLGAREKGNAMVEPFRPGLLERLLGDLFRVVNRRIVWHRLGFLLSVINLVALRTNLRRFNLYDTERREPEAPSPEGRDVRATRTPNGSYNDLSQPSMGMAGTRFGRNVPPAARSRRGEPARSESAPDQPQAADARRLHPGFDLNVFAGAWVQFMVHDWFSHGRGASPEQVEPIRVPIDEDDPFPEKPMIVPRTQPDPTRGPADEGKPPTFINVETHWWDASQIYGRATMVSRASAPTRRRARR